MLAGPKELFVLPAAFQQRVDVVGGVFQAVLFQHPGPAGQAHAGEAVVLGHHDVPGTHPVDQGKVHAVCAFVEHQRLGALPLDAVGGCLLYTSDAADEL